MKTFCTIFIKFCGRNFNLRKVSVPLLHLARKTWKAKNRGSWIVIVLANETKQNRCYRTSSTDRSRLRPLLNDVQPRLACWSSGMILALGALWKVPVRLPDRPFVILFCQWTQHSNEAGNITMVFVTSQLPYETTELLPPFFADNSNWLPWNPSRLKYHLTSCFCWPGNISTTSRKILILSNFDLVLLF